MNKPLRYINIFIILFTFSVILSSCDIVDAIADVFNGDDNTNNINQQELALTTVLTIQDDASDIMDNLFVQGMDTLSVIDSLANFFLSDTSTQNVWPDSEGVAVDYKNGISGGIFVGRYNPAILEGTNPDTLIPDLPKNSSRNNKFDNIKPTPLNANSIYFDGGYSEFSTYNAPKISAANNNLSKIGIAPFVQYLDYEATLDVLSTLDQYGIIHLSGHGWHKYYGNGVWADKVTYLLTGEVAQVGKTYSDLWKDILDKKIIIATYGHNKENRYWVSPEFISDRNSFHDKKTFIYIGICHGGRKAWRNAMLDKAGASAIVRYNWAVRVDYETDWAIAMYDRMCDIELNKPKTIRECVIEIINHPKGRYEIISFDEPSFWIHMKYKGDKNYTFWEKEEELTMYGAHIMVSVGNVIGRKRTSYEYDGAWVDLNHESLQFFNLDTGPGDTYSSPGSFTNNIYTGSINNYNGNSRTVDGTIQIAFQDDDRYSLDLHINKTESGNDVWDGGAWSNLTLNTRTSNWTEHIVLDYAGVPGGWDKTDDYPAASLYPNTETKKIVYYEVYDRSDSDLNVTYTTTGVHENGDTWNYEYVSHSIPDNANKIEVTVFYK